LKFLSVPDSQDLNVVGQLSGWGGGCDCP